MNSFQKLLQNSDTFSYLSENKKEEVEELLSKILESSVKVSLTDGFFQSYLETKFSLNKDIVSLILSIGKQAGIFNLKYLIENPITGSTIKIIDENELTNNRLVEIQEELTDEDGNEIFSEVTPKDIYPFYYLRRNMIYG